MGVKVARIMHPIYSAVLLSVCENNYFETFIYSIMFVLAFHFCLVFPAVIHILYQNSDTDYLSLVIKIQTQFPFGNWSDIEHEKMVKITNSDQIL